MRKFIEITPEDNVVVAVQDCKKGDILDTPAGKITLAEDIPAGHKIALKDFHIGDNIIKYSYPIGHAEVEIPKGGWVYEKRIKTNLNGLLEYSYRPNLKEPVVEKSTLTFQGFRRKNGSVGTRNQIWIIPTVGCVNGTVRKLAELLRRETEGDGSTVDAIVPFEHNYGCSQLGGDHENTRKILRDLVEHPNAGGVLVVGLGCENNQVSLFKEFIGAYDDQRVRFMETQKVPDELEYGMEQLRELYDIAAQDQRTEEPISELRIGLKCGGSDGFSGITANPLLGRLTDFLTGNGGTAILTEVPEMFGAETILMNRCANEEIFDKTVHLINDFKEYFIQNKMPVYENPSPGNKAGGISTLEDKSLGCVQKSGKAIVQDVLKYGDRVHTKGLNLLSAPGNDLVASTALATAGCQIILFTTGRGTPFGSPVPTVKVSSNSGIYHRKPNWIDFNAGVVLEDRTLDTLLPDFVQYIIGIANGNLTNNEKNGFRDFAIFKSGVTL